MAEQENLQCYWQWQNDTKDKEGFANFSPSFNLIIEEKYSAWKTLKEENEKKEAKEKKAFLDFPVLKLKNSDEYYLDFDNNMQINLQHCNRQRKIRRIDPKIRVLDELKKEVEEEREKKRDRSLNYSRIENNQENEINDESQEEIQNSIKNMDGLVLKQLEKFCRKQFKMLSKRLDLLENSFKSQIDEFKKSSYQVRAIRDEYLEFKEKLHKLKNQILTNKNECEKLYENLKWKVNDLNMNLQQKPSYFKNIHNFNESKESSFQSELIIDNNNFANNKQQMRNQIDTKFKSIKNSEDEIEEQQEFKKNQKQPTNNQKQFNRANNQDRMQNLIFDNKTDFNPLFIS